MVSVVVWWWSVVGDGLVEFLLGMTAVTSGSLEDKLKCMCVGVGEVLMCCGSCF